MGAAEDMEQDGHVMTPSRRAVIEAFERLVDRVDSLEQRMAHLEATAAIGETLLVSALNDLRHLAARMTAVLPVAPGPPAEH